MLLCLSLITYMLGSLGQKSNPNPGACWEIMASPCPPGGACPGVDFEGPPRWTIVLFNFFAGGGFGK